MLLRLSFTAIKISLRFYEMRYPGKHLHSEQITLRYLNEIHIMHKASAFQVFFIRTPIREAMVNYGIGQLLSS